MVMMIGRVGGARDPVNAGGEQGLIAWGSIKRMILCREEVSATCNLDEIGKMWPVNFHCFCYWIHFLLVSDDSANQIMRFGHAPSLAHLRLSTISILDDVAPNLMRAIPIGLWSSLHHSQHHWMIPTPLFLT